MPDAEGKLSEDENKRAIAWVTEKWGAEDRCPMHGGSTNWEVGNQLVFVVLPGLAKGLPLISVTCHVCGLNLFVRAATIGIRAQGQ